MNNETILTLLKKEDFYLDPLGRLIIGNEELLKAIHGALGHPHTVDVMTDVGCSNTGCT